MYNSTLLIHSWARWLVLILGVVVILKSLFAWLGQKKYEKLDNILGASFVGFMHLQLLLGLLLYFVLSPVGLQAIQNSGMKAVMKDSNLRFWAVEHITVMILAVVLAQVGRSLAKKASVDVAKHKKSFMFFTITLVLVLSRIPWDR
ncbi:MAG: hypothetical protein SFU27_07395 [Thermonemataceae bacterium]|nr:hypothetical protein [Thermonemataceae bacterium]